MERKAVLNSNATRYLALEKYNELMPHAIQSLAKAYTMGLFLGDTQPYNWSYTYWKHLGGISINKGTGENLRTGTQVQLKSTLTLTLSDPDREIFAVLRSNAFHAISPTQLTFSPDRRDGELRDIANETNLWEPQTFF